MGHAQLEDLLLLLLAARVEQDDSAVLVGHQVGLQGQALRQQAGSNCRGGWRRQQGASTPLNIPDSRTSAMEGLRHSLLAPAGCGRHGQAVQAVGLALCSRWT